MTDQKKHILIVDDHKDIRDTIRESLEQEGFVVSSATNAKTMIGRLQSTPPDLILLDLVLPDEFGLNLIEKIREFSPCPIIIISGKGELIDKVLGLEKGANDYIAKPFHMKELIARVKVHTRLSLAHPVFDTQTNTAAQNKIMFGEWMVDRNRLQAFDQNNQSANLTVKEFRLLETFLLTPNVVLSREQLLDKSRLNDFNVTDRAIDTQITRIRKKLRHEPDTSPIQSVRGAGYILSLRTESSL